MSCTTNRHAFRCGSILMEFVMVLPIYIFLFGAIFLIGEIGLNAIRISVGDRSLAMDADDGEGYSFAPFGLMQMGEESENIRSKEDRERYEASMHQGSDLMANSSPVYSVKARFDLPDEVTDVMLVADLPDTCETRYITLHREDDGNYNYVGTGVLGDAVEHELR